MEGQPAQCMSREETWKGNNCLLRDRDWFLLLEQEAKSPDHHTPGPPQTQGLPWRPKGPEAVTRSLLCPQSLSVILSSGAPGLPLSPPLWCPQGWPIAGLQSWCQGTR